MKKNIENYVKDFLFARLLRETGDAQAETWAYLKTLDLNGDDLDLVIMNTPFADEAWEIFKTKNPTKTDWVYSLKYVSNTKDVEAYLLAHFELDNEELEDLIKMSDNEAFAQLLLNQNPSNEQLESLMSYTNLKDEAAKLLLSRTPLDNDELKYIIRDSNLKMEAWERLLLQEPTNEDLQWLINYTDLEDLAWTQLLQQNPTNEELLDFVKDYSEIGRKKDAAATLLMARDLNADELVDFIIHDQYADWAIGKLKAMTITCDDLEAVFRAGKVKINEIADLSLSLNPDQDQLWQIFKCSDRKNEAALQLIKHPLELHELADLVVETSIEPVLELVSQRIQFDRSQVDESALIQSIAQKLLQNPDLLNVNNWHDGETHCLGGWAITLHDKAQDFEKEFGSEIIASLLLPSYRHLFFVDKPSVLEALKAIALN